MKVRNMDGNTGPVANQFIIDGDDGSETFQSYSSVVAVRARGGSITLDESTWDYSMTTGRYRNQFLGEKKAETEKKIKSGEYKLANLSG